jgi:hypothetical protein
VLHVILHVFLIEFFQRYFNFTRRIKINDFLAQEDAPKFLRPESIWIFEKGQILIDLQREDLDAIIGISRKFSRFLKIFHQTWFSVRKIEIIPSRFKI